MPDRTFSSNSEETQLKRACWIFIAAALLLPACVHPAANETLLPPASEPDLNTYILEHYQEDVDRAFEATERVSLGTFSRMRVELSVDETGRVEKAKTVIHENWNFLLLSKLRPAMRKWKLPAKDETYVAVVELVRSVDSLRKRPKDFWIEM